MFKKISLSKIVLYGVSLIMAGFFGAFGHDLYLSLTSQNLVFPSYTIPAIIAAIGLGLIVYDLFLIKKDDELRFSPANTS